MSRQSTIKLLFVLLILFFVRVLAQLLQNNLEISWLPAFDAWHSATIPYSWLLISQVVITTIIVSVIVHIQRGSYLLKKARASLLLWIGAIYFLFMLMRFILSITLMTTHPWFGATLPALFHMVLASVFLVIGLYEWDGYRKLHGK